MTDVRTQPARREPGSRVETIDAVFVLCGMCPRTGDLAGLDRPPGLLPLTAGGRTNVERLRDAVGPLARGCLENGRFRVLVEQSLDTASVTRPGIDGTLLPDRAEYRGTGGVLRDAASDLDDNERILVLVASEVDESDIGPSIETLARADSDVALCRDASHAPVGMWTIRAGCLRGVSPIGYADFKEQVLSQLVSEADVRVVTLDHEGSRRHALRDLASYLACARAMGGLGGGGVLVEDGVGLDPGALVVDSVLLRGAAVEHGAVVARSLVGPGSRVRSGEVVVDACA